MLLIAYGTRPEWIKIKPIVDLLDQKGYAYKLLFTRQHTTLVHGKFDRTINILEWGNRLDSIFTSILNVNSIFEDISRVMVQGDTATAFAISLAAFHRKIPVIHLEAGLRTYDTSNPYPEEFYRKAISAIAYIHLCPTEMNKKNLERESVGGKIHVVGNTSIDAILSCQDKVSVGGGCIITLHRRENRPIMDRWLKSLNDLAKKKVNVPFWFICHPNLDVRKEFSSDITSHLNFLQPMPHDEMIEMILHCDILISDSGGIQEEAAFFRKPVIVCRTVTERPESLASTSYLCRVPEELERMWEYARIRTVPPYDCPFGDGHTAEKVVKILYEQ